MTVLLQRALFVALLTRASSLTTVESVLRPYGVVKFCGTYQASAVVAFFSWGVAALLRWSPLANVYFAHVVLLLSTFVHPPSLRSRSSRFRFRFLARTLWTPALAFAAYSNRPFRAAAALGVTNTRSPAASALTQGALQRCVSASLWSFIAVDWVLDLATILRHSADTAVLCSLAAVRVADAWHCPFGDIGNPSFTGTEHSERSTPTSLQAVSVYTAFPLPSDSLEAIYALRTRLRARRVASLPQHSVACSPPAHPTSSFLPTVPLRPSTTPTLAPSPAPSHHLPPLANPFAVRVLCFVVDVALILAHTAVYHARSRGVFVCRCGVDVLLCRGDVLSSTNGRGHGGSRCVAGIRGGEVCRGVCGGVAVAGGVVTDRVPPRCWELGWGGEEGVSGRPLSSRSNGPECSLERGW